MGRMRPNTTPLPEADTQGDSPRHRDRLRTPPRRRGAQPGFVREAVLIFVILSAIGLVVLDTLSVYSAHRTLKEQAAKAAGSAMAAFINSASDAVAQDAADSYLRAHDATLAAFHANHVNGDTWYVVTAKGKADTYVFRHLERLPWGAGGWIRTRLHPTATAGNRD